MITNTRTTPAAAGTIGYHASIDRPSSSRAPICQSAYHATRAEAYADCLERIKLLRVRVKPSDTLTSYEFTASGDGGWQCLMSKISEKSETVTIAAARDAAAKPSAFRENLPFLAATN